MKKLIRGRSTAAMVIAVVALVAAVAGAAVAGPIASTSKLSKKDKRKVTGIADAEIAKLAPGLAVKSAGSATTANTASSATTADTATTAGSLIMTGHVSSTGVLSNARGIGSVTLGGVSIRCLEGLAASPSGGVATVDYNDSTSQDAQVGLGDASGSCPPGTKAFVSTHIGATSSAAGFFVTLWS